MTKQHIPHHTMTSTSCILVALLVLVTASCAGPEQLNSPGWAGVTAVDPGISPSAVTSMPARMRTSPPTEITQDDPVPVSPSPQPKPSGALAKTPQGKVPTRSATPQRTQAMRTPTPSRQPLVPSPQMSRTPTATSQKTARGTATTLATTATAGQTRKLPRATPGSDRRRVCVGVPKGQLVDYDWGAGAPGLYVSWRVIPNPPDTGGIRLAQLLRTYADTISPTLTLIRSAATRNPGSLWLIGNEPDVVAQDNATPEQYARNYGIAYRVIKEADPSAQVAIAGVSQPTPLRMAYLDRVLAAYRQQYGKDMPVDVWNVHAYILREQRDSWGVGIPPGMKVDRGQLYEVKDHGDMDIFRQQIADFRRWMAERGQRDKPLIVSEYGILMPEEYGFPPEAVGQFLVDTFDFFLTARDEQTGYPSDDSRLVQTFCWFSAAMPGWPTSDLFSPVTHEITPVGKVFRAYVAALK